MLDPCDARCAGVFIGVGVVLGPGTAARENGFGAVDGFAVSVIAGTVLSCFATFGSAFFAFALAFASASASARWNDVAGVDVFATGLDLPAVLLMSGIGGEGILGRGGDGTPPGLGFSSSGFWESAITI